MKKTWLFGAMVLGAALAGSAQAEMMWNMGGGNYQLQQPGRQPTNIFNSGGGNYMVEQPGRPPTMMWNMGGGNYWIQRPQQPGLRLPLDDSGDE